MRNAILTLAPMLLSASLTAQGVFSNKTQAILEKVIQDSSKAKGYSWNRTVMEAGNFETAKSRFAEVFGQIHNCIITTNAQKTFILSGQYEAPAPEKETTCIIFSLLPGVGEMKKLKVALRLHHEGDGYSILLSVNDSDPKEETGGVVTAN